jgi:RNA-binding protein
MGYDMTGKQRAMLRGMANTIDTILYIGKDGITDHTVKEAYDALEARELIKGCVQQGAPLTAREALTALCERTHAEPIQQIGRRFVLYRPSRENPRISIDG